MLWEAFELELLDFFCLQIDKNSVDESFQDPEIDKNVVKVVEQKNSFPNLYSQFSKVDDFF